MKNYQHQPLRKPEGWTGQDAALVIQLERQLDDIYRKLGALKEKIGDVESNSLTISEQELTSTEQSRVRNNIGAASASDLSLLSDHTANLIKYATATKTGVTLTAGASGYWSVSYTTPSDLADEKNIISVLPYITAISATTGLQLTFPYVSTTKVYVHYYAPSAISNVTLAFKIYYKT